MKETLTTLSSLLYSTLLKSGVDNKVGFKIFYI